MRAAEEDPVVACNGLLAVIDRLAGSVTDARALNHALSFALRDMAGKCRRLSPEIGNQFYEKAKELALRHTLHEVIEEIDREVYREILRPEEGSREDSSPARKKPEADAVVLTIIREEFEAALRVFGVDQDKAKREFEFHGRDFFAIAISQNERRFGKRPLRVLITMVGSPRNIPCANVCRDILERLNTGVLILVGICGGNRRKSLRLGDVVAGEAVVDIEGGRSELVPRIGLRFRGRGYWWDRLITKASMKLFGEQREVSPRIQIATPPSPLREYVEKFEPSQSDLHESIRVVLERYPANQLPWGRRATVRQRIARILGWFLPLGLPQSETDYAAKFHFGHIMCGEKVLADGSIPEIASRHHGNIIAVDMESFGFAEACRHRSHQWAIFRGISDYADPKKGDRWHVPAAVAAAATAKIFLTRAYTPADERDFW